ncbi:MAG: hypothetical protein AAGA11_23035 [Pseudomonadota bacterium]
MALIGSGCPILPRLPITARAATRSVAQPAARPEFDGLNAAVGEADDAIVTDPLDIPAPATLALVTVR